MPSLCLCAIVRNEAGNLPRLLDSVAGLVDETVLLDTGSTDATVDLARAHGARVHEAPWPDSFAAARNQALALCRTDWILSLDADESLERADHDLVRHHIADPQVHVVTVELINYMRGGVTNRFPYPRLYRRDPAIHYEGRVHNQLVSPYPAVASAIRVHHWGYLRTGSHRARRLEQTLALCKANVAERPHDPDAIYYLAQTYFQGGDYPAGVATLERLFEVLPGGRIPAGSFFGDAFVKLAFHHLNSQQPDVALRWLQQGLAQGVVPVDLHFLAGRAELLLGRLEAALQHWQAYLATKAALEHGRLARGALALYFVDPVHEQEVWESISSTYARLGRPAESMAVLDEWVAKAPDNPDALAKLVGAEILAGRLPQAVRRLAARPVTMPVTPALRLMETEAALRSGEPAGEAEARAFVEAQPLLWQPRERYAFWLAKQGRSTEALALADGWLRWLPADPAALALRRHLTGEPPAPSVETDPLLAKWVAGQADPDDLLALSEAAEGTGEAPLALLAAGEAWARSPRPALQERYLRLRRGGPGERGQVTLLPDRPQRDFLDAWQQRAGRPVAWDHPLAADERALILVPHDAQAARGWLELAEHARLPLTLAIDPTLPAHRPWLFAKPPHGIVGWLETPLVPNLFEPWRVAVRRWQRQAADLLVPIAAARGGAHPVLVQTYTEGACDLAAVALSALGVRTVLCQAEPQPHQAFWLKPAELPATALPWAWTFPTDGMWLQRHPTTASGPLPAPDRLSCDGEPCPIETEPDGWQATLPRLGAGLHRLQAGIGDLGVEWVYGTSSG